jgi:hypothetical protein
VQCTVECWLSFTPEQYWPGATVSYCCPALWERDAYHLLLLGEDQNSKSEVQFVLNDDCLGTNLKSKSPKSGTKSVFVKCLDWGLDQVSHQSIWLSPFITGTRRCKE